MARCRTELSLLLPGKAPSSNVLTGRFSGRRRASRPAPGALWLVALLWITVFFTGRLAVAHTLQPGVLSLLEITPNHFLVRWVPPSTGHGPSAPVTIALPPQCRSELGAPASTGAVGGSIECGSPGLVGTIAFTSPGNVVGPVAVNVDFLVGEDWFRVSRDEPATVELPNARRDALSWQVARDFVGLGVEHIWGGADHVLFVLGLLLLVRTGKRLLGTITAFTLAHSITLSAATLGWMRVPAAPVEICIALSICLLAVETSQNGDTLTRRAPWWVAFAFGLLHGFGFASALASTQLPADRLVLSLLSFNVGVELGQLVLIGVAAAVWWRLPAAARSERRLERVASFVLGSASTYWLLQRVEQWLSALTSW